MEDTAFPSSVGWTEHELASGIGFVGVADYTSPSLHNILEDKPDDCSGSEAGTDGCGHPSRECNVFDEVNRTPTGTVASICTSPPQLTPEQLEAHRRERAERLQAQQAELEAQRAQLRQARVELDGS